MTGTRKALFSPRPSALSGAGPVCFLLAPAPGPLLGSVGDRDLLPVLPQRVLPASPGLSAGGGDEWWPQSSAQGQPCFSVCQTLVVSTLLTAPRLPCVSPCPASSVSVPVCHQALVLSEEAELLSTYCLFLSTSVMYAPACW